jgi:hypothetical protein
MGNDGANRTREGTDMAAANGKLFADWARLNGTIAYLEALSDTMGIPIVKLIEVLDTQNPL